MLICDELVCEFSSQLAENSNINKNKKAYNKTTNN